MGSDLRGDDAFGPLLARRLAEEGLPALDGGTSPESLTGPILRFAPAVLILADAANLRAPPGTARLLDPAFASEGGTSTHDPSLRVLTTDLTAERPMTVRLLAAQWQRKGLGEPPSAAVRALVASLAEGFAAASAEARGVGRPRGDASRWDGVG